MASSYTGLGTELMTTGENAGTWGTTTNTNLQIIEQLSGGYIEKAVTSTPTTLSVSDGSAGAELAHRIIKFTGTISEATTVTVPLDVQQMYILMNGTSGNYTVTFKYVTGSGDTVVFKGTDKGTKLVYATADDGTNPNMVDTGIASHQIHNTLTVGIDDTGYDVKLFGATAGSYALWDESADSLLLTDSTPLKIGDSQDLTLYHDGSNSYITNAVGALKLATETSGIALTIGHTTSETTIADNLTVTGTLTGTLATAAQGSVTSLGTLTALTVDDVAVNGKVVTMTGSASDTAVLTAGTNGTLSIVTTDAAAAAANIQITADGTVDIDSAGVLTLDSGAAINIEPASGSAILLDGTISVDAGVVTGATSITSTAFVGDITGDVTGNTSGTAATVTTAAQTNITSLGTLTTLTVDNVIVNGTTIGHTSDTDLLTLTSAVLTVAGELDAATLDISGNADIDGTTNLDAVDIDGAVQIDATFTSGVDGQGYDTKFFGDTSSAYMLWDTSADDLVLAGAAGIDLAGDIDVDGTANLDAVDIDGAVQIDGAVTVGVDDTGLDVKFFGASAGAYGIYDQSEDAFEIRGATAAGAGLLKLTTGELTVVDGNKLGQINFQAPLESDGSDSILVGASIYAEADDTFSATVNNTDIVFATGKTATAAERFRFTADNEIGIAGANYGTDGQVLTSGGAGAAVAWEDVTGSVTAINNATANELVTIGSTTTELDAEANLTFDGTDVLVGGAGKVQLRDTGLYVASNADGDLDIVSDGTAVDSINLESAGGITLDAGTASSGIVYEDDGTEMLRVHNSSSDVIVESKVSDKDIIFKVNDGGSGTEVARFDGDVSASY